MNDLNVSVGDSAGRINVKGVEGDNTEINTSSKKPDVDLLMKLLKQETPEVLNHPEFKENFSELEKSNSDGLETAINFFLKITEGVTIRWLAQTLLS